MAQSNRVNFIADGSALQPLEERYLLATFAVTNLFDAGSGSLRQAVLDANAGGDPIDDIEFQAGLSGTITLTSGEIPMTSSLNIHGPGPGSITVSGNNTSRIFQIDDGKLATAIAVDITGLTLTDGNAGAGGDGGAIRSVENLRISDARITGNTAGGRGGGISLDFLLPDLAISHTTISGNSAGSRGGGIFAFNARMITIDGSTISGNSTGSDGGGIYAASVGTMTIDASTISGNSAAGFGGGVRLQNPSGAVTIASSTISGNSAAGQGGGISAVTYVSGTTTIASSTISGNSAGSRGGGIAALNLFGGGTTTIDSSTISGNSAGFGGGIWSSTSGTLTIGSSTFSDNSAGYGGGIAVFDDGGTAAMEKCTISGNSAADGGGGMWLSIEVAGTMTIDSSTISGNVAAGSDGGGLATSSFRGAMTVDSSTISGNSAAGQGGGMRLQNYMGSTTITRSTISGNSAGSEGGGISYNHRNSPTFLASSIVAGNTASSDGPDLFPSLGSFNVSFSLIEDNTGSGLSEAPVGSPDANGNLIGGPLNGTISPLLGPLADNGGPTESRAPLSGSPAIDAGDPGFVPPPVYDQRAAPFSRVFAGRIDMGAIEFIDGDFNRDGAYDCADVNALVATIAATTNDATYDLNSDLFVNQEDLDIWLAVAGVANLPSHDPFLKGDADLNGVVDGSDFNIWNANKFTNTAAWCAGDFNADGMVDGCDFHIWNEHKFQTSLGSSPIESQLSARHALRESGARSVAPEQQALRAPSQSANRPAAVPAAWRMVDSLWADVGMRRHSFREWRSGNERIDPIIKFADVERLPGWHAPTQAEVHFAWLQGPIHQRT